MPQLHPGLYQVSYCFEGRELLTLPSIWAKALVDAERASSAGFANVHIVKYVR